MGRGRESAGFCFNSSDSPVMSGSQVQFKQCGCRPLVAVSRHYSQPGQGLPVSDTGKGREAPKPSYLQVLWISGFRGRPQSQQQVFPQGSNFPQNGLHVPSGLDTLLVTNRFSGQSLDPSVKFYALGHSDPTVFCLSFSIQNR